MSSTKEVKRGILTEGEEEEACVMAMQLACGSILPMVLKAAIELDLFEMMAKAGPGAYVSPAELADQLPTQNPNAPAMLDRILRLFACNSLLKCTHRQFPDGDGRVERLYGLTPVSKFFTRNTDGVSIAPLVVLGHDKVFMESLCHLKDAVLEGGLPFKKAHGMTLFEYNGTDPKFNKVFNEAMSNHSTIVVKKILETYKGFEALSSIVDVGGGIGVTLNMIVSKYPSIKGINFDLPHVLRDALVNLGVELVGGDMFVSVPKGDAILLKWICHDWSDQHCLKLLKNCYEALSENGKVIVIESILPEVPSTDIVTNVVIQEDLVMLAQNPGGKERTKKEFEALAKEAGFEGFQVVCRAFDIWIMEFLKKN